MLVIIASVVGWGSMASAVELDLGNFTLDIHGFLSQGYLQSDHNNFLAETEEGTFEFREYAVNASSNLTDQLRVGAQLFGRDFGDFGNDEIVLDWGFADFRFQDWLGLRAGRMKIMLGLYNETRDIDMVRTSIFLPESIYNDAFRESFTAMNGVALYGTIFSDMVGSLSYQAQWGKIKIETDGGVSRFIQNFFPMDISSAETSDVYVAGVEWVPSPPFDGLRLRWTWNTWDMDYEATTNSVPFWQLRNVPAGLPLTYHADLDITVLSAEYRWGNLVLAAETFAPANYDNSLKSPALGLTFFDDSPDKAGYYVSAAYSVTDWFEIGAAYSEYYNNKHDKDGTLTSANTGMQKHRSWLKDTMLTTRFDIAESWVIKLEGHIMDGADVLLSEQNPDGTEQNWFLFGAKVTYNF
jgi:hypothetical protein